jgi:hypothetical protein
MAGNQILPVTVDNYVRAETARMFDGTIERANGTNRFVHNRVPTPMDKQNVIRLNRDTLYSQGVFDISQGATLTLPEAEGRYMTVMVINEDHYINRVFSEPGSYDLTVDEFDSEFVAVFMRTFVDPSDPDDVATVNALQDELVLETNASRSYTHPRYSEDDRVRIFDASAQIGIQDTTGAFGRREDVDPIRHLIGTTIGWGGLPESEAFYTGEPQPQPVGRYTLTFKDVPVDGFWSITVYNRDGFMEENPYSSYSVNNVTATASDDGSVVVNLAPEPDGLDNHLYIMDGWNYVLRLYRPRPSVLDGSWVAPTPELA